MTKNLLVLLFGVLVSIIFLETFLRIYNPFQFRIKAGRIILPANQKYIIQNNDMPRLDKTIVVTKNSLGFRGEEIPPDLENFLSIITVGGSTTECSKLSDNRAWPHLLGKKLKQSYKDVWVNNAGLDGHSTFGHIILLKDHLVKIRPKIIIFLVCRNDIGRDDLRGYDRVFLKYHENDFRSLLKKSEVVWLIHGLKRYFMARQLNLHHYSRGIKDITEYGTLTIPEEVQQIEMRKHTLKYIPGYKERLTRLAELSKRNGIIPVFVTQPALWGKGIERHTGIDLETVRLSPSMNGELFWKILELYNRATKEVCKAENTFVIDLANKLPKAWAYFYDDVHFTNKGAARVSEILCGELQEYFDSHYTRYR